MKKTIVRQPKKRFQLRDIGDKLDNIEGKVDELLSRIAPKPLREKSQIIAQNEPEYRPSSHSASLTARGKTPNLKPDLYDTPIRQYDIPPVRVDPHLGSL